MNIAASNSAILTMQAEQAFLDEEVVVEDYREADDGTLYSVFAFTRPDLRMNEHAYMVLPGDYHEGARYRLRLALDCLAGNENDELERECAADIEAAEQRWPEEK